MNSAEYIKERLDDQINWYSKKSTYYKKCFYSLRILEIIVAGLIPVFFYCPAVKDWVPFFSAIVVVIVGLIALLKFQENWILYRTTSENLKYEKYLYITKVYPYNSDNSFETLVKHIENIIIKERSIWKQKYLSNK